MSSSEFAASSSQLQDIADLYSNPYAPKTSEIQQLSRNAQDKFNYYIDKINKIENIMRENSGGNQWEIWQTCIQNLYKEIVFDAFEAAACDLPVGMEIHVTGSLAKKQATAFSDLDSFVLFENEHDKDATKVVFENINHLLLRIHKQTNHLYPDPAGINPARFAGTPQQLYTKLKEGDVLDTGLFIRTIFTSKPILGQYTLCEELKELINGNQELKANTTAQSFYEKALEFKAPQPHSAKIDLKSHLLRPLDFVLMGLRKELSIDAEDGAYLSSTATIDLLKQNQGKLDIISMKEIEQLERLYSEAMILRHALHKQHGKEHDDIDKSDQINELLACAETARQIAARRIEAIQQKQEVPKIDDYDIRHDDQNYSIQSNKTMQSRNGNQYLLLIRNVNKHSFFTPAKKKIAAGAVFATAAVATTAGVLTAVYCSTAVATALTAPAVIAGLSTGGLALAIGLGVLTFIAAALLIKGAIDLAEERNNSAKLKIY